MRLSDGRFGAGVLNVLALWSVGLVVLCAAGVWMMIKKPRRSFGRTSLSLAGLSRHIPSLGGASLGPPVSLHGLIPVEDIPSASTSDWAVKELQARKAQDLENCGMWCRTGPDSPVSLGGR